MITKSILKYLFNKNMKPNETGIMLSKSIISFRQIALWFVNNALVINVSNVLHRLYYYTKLCEI